MTVETLETPQITRVLVLQTNNVENLALIRDSSDRKLRISNFLESFVRLQLPVLAQNSWGGTVDFYTFRESAPEKLLEEYQRHAPTLNGVVVRDIWNHALKVIRKDLAQDTYFNYNAKNYLLIYERVLKELGNKAIPEDEREKIMDHITNLHLRNEGMRATQEREQILQEAVESSKMIAKFYQNAQVLGEVCGWVKLKTTGGIYYEMSYPRRRFVSEETFFSMTDEERKNGIA